MAEDKYKFYLNDRWFHLIKEHDDILKYASNINKPTDGIIIEKHISDNSLDIFYYIKNKLYSKISVSDITKKDIFFHYRDIIPHLNHIDGEDYVNLMLDAFSQIRYGNKVAQGVVIIKKKKNLRRLCYREPTFPLDMSLDLSDLKVSSPTLTYFFNLVDNFKIYIPKVKELEVEDDKMKEKDSTINELVIPSTIFMFDREYTFVKNNLGELHYTNTEDGVSNLVINYDYFHNYLEGISINFKDDTSNLKTSCTCQIYKNDCGGVSILFYNGLKERININSQPLDDVKYRYMAKYDEAKNQISNYLEMEVNRKRKVYYSHPTFRTTFVDELGNSYHIANQNFAKLHSMVSFSAYAFEALEKKLVK